MTCTLICYLTMCLSGLTSISGATTLRREAIRADIEACDQIALGAGIDGLDTDTYLVEDLSGNTFYIRIGNSGGFVAYDPISNQLLEKSAEMESPYDFDSDGDYYYLGPMNYYQEIDGKFYSLFDGRYVSEDYMYELQAIFDSQLETLRQGSDTLSYGSEISTLDSEITYVENYEIIRDCIHPDNWDGSCGFVAATIVLYYWQRTMYDETILPQYLDDDGNLNNTGTIYDSDTNLKDLLVELNGGETSSWAATVKSALAEYCDMAGLSYETHWYIFDWYAKSEIRNSRPVILFGSLPDTDSDDSIKHAVVAYGIDDGHYVVNYGWGSDTAEVTMNGAFIGSVTTFRLKGYEQSVTITPDDYGFDGSYNSTEITSSHSVDGLNFTTTRLRTGYIESEYITMSPRRKGYGTAYIQYDFENPVDSITVDLTFWSSEERYYSWDLPTAVLQYASLTDENTWIAREDLLSIGLPTDRTKPTTYTFDFPQRTKKFRFYTHFPLMSGWTDRNKGRICIGDMTVDTYF